MIQLQTLLALANSSHTEIQLDRFITVRSGGTPYGCLFQSLRELLKRFRGLNSDYCERRKLLLRIERFESLVNGDGFKARLAAVKLDEARFGLAEVERHTRNDEREFLRFYSQAASLYCHLGFDREPPTPERLEELDRERWEWRILADAAMSYMSSGGIGQNIVALVQCLEPPMRKRILTRMFGTGGSPDDRRRSLDALVNWFLAYDPGLPSPLALSEEESRRLLACCESSTLPRLLPTSSPTAAGASPRISISSGCESANHALNGQVFAAASAGAG
jgi:hypothetical protein